MFAITAASAQPKARRTVTATKSTTTTKAAANQSQGANANNPNGISQRALISFPTQQTMQEDVVWRRDIYREIDLTEDANSGLYYPVEPVGSQMNLFTYMFKLMLSGQVPAYEYRLDGNESFDAASKIKPLAFMDDYHIYYERKDGKLKLDNSDIPSREVKSYYIKECAYYDQQSATFHKKVVALCPIMSREDDFGAGTAKYPLFWVKYDDIAPFLSKQIIMTSNLNNASTMSVDDYFVKNQYKGTIYKTNNMLGQTLAQATAGNSSFADDADGMMDDTKAKAKQDSLMKAEQDKIEAELAAFEKNMWYDQARKDTLDSIAAREAAAGKDGKKVKKSSRRSSSSNTTEAKPAKAKKSTSSASSTSAARVSVRRQRH